ncbi:hypothetical protein NVIRPANT_00801 [Pantoea sp. Nvir]|nr:hypothetical protein NVIRPANT_00801 [Pantoea sp. Nvir]
MLLCGGGSRIHSAYVMSSLIATRDYFLLEQNFGLIHTVRYPVIRLVLVMCNA